MYYNHRHFYVSENFAGEYLLYAGYTCIAKFYKRYWADKARKHLQHLLDSFQWSTLAHEICVLLEHPPVYIVWHPDIRL